MHVEASHAEALYTFKAKLDRFVMISTNQWSARFLSKKMCETCDGRDKKIVQRAERVANWQRIRGLRLTKPWMTETNGVTEARGVFINKQADGKVYVQREQPNAACVPRVCKCKKCERTTERNLGESVCPEAPPHAAAQARRSFTRPRPSAATALR